MHLIHRGIVKKQYKENLLKSFNQSFKKGYGIETDIHATKDHEFICFHDFTLNRIFKKKVSVKNIKYSQIKKISVKNKNNLSNAYFNFRLNFNLNLRLKFNLRLKLATQIEIDENGRKIEIEGSKENQ